MLAALTAEGLGHVDELTLAYHVEDLGTTRGTTLSALEMIKGGDVEWRDRRYVPASRRAGRGRFGFPAPIGLQRVGRYPSGEQITVPRHVDVDTVRTVIGLRGLIGAELGPVAGPLMTASGYAMAHAAAGARREGRRAPSRGPVATSARAKARYTIVCEARTPAGDPHRRPPRHRRLRDHRADHRRGRGADGRPRLRAAAAAWRRRRPSIRPAFLAALEPFGITTEIDPR